jgi:hypothetical protein
MEKKLAIVACAFHYSYGQKHKIKGSQSRLTQAKSETLFQNNQSKRSGEQAAWLKW